MALRFLETVYRFRFFHYFRSSFFLRRADLFTSAPLKTNRTLPLERTIVLHRIPEPVRVNYHFGKQKRLINHTRYDDTPSTKRTFVRAEVTLVYDHKSIFVNDVIHVVENPHIFLFADDVKFVNTTQSPYIIKNSFLSIFFFFCFVLILSIVYKIIFFEQCFAFYSFNYNKDIYMAPSW